MTGRAKDGEAGGRKMWLLDGHVYCGPHAYEAATATDSWTYLGDDSFRCVICEPAPRPVAECWTCIPGSGLRGYDGEWLDDCRAAGHDVREVKP